MLGLLSWYLYKRTFALLQLNGGWLVARVILQLLIYAFLSGLQDGLKPEPQVCVSVRQAEVLHCMAWGGRS